MGGSGMVQNQNDGSQFRTATAIPNLGMGPAPVDVSTDLHLYIAPSFLENDWHLLSLTCDSVLAAGKEE